MGISTITGINPFSDDSDVLNNLKEIDAKILSNIESFQRLLEIYKKTYIFLIDNDNLFTIGEKLLVIKKEIYQINIDEIKTELKK